jgi:hypothetical protein
VLGVGVFIVTNTMANLSKQGIASGSASSAVPRDSASR